MTDDPIRLYRFVGGIGVEIGGRHFVVPDLDWDAMFNDPNLGSRLEQLAEEGREVGAPETDRLLPPIGQQEIWAAGVTYLRSKTARMSEAAGAGGGDFYDRVYEATRPELFFKATPHRVVGPGESLRIRRDSAWSVPEPELAVAIDRDGRLVGYSIGNDMSARDIEGENPLYLPQAKIHDQCCGLGPCLLVTSDPLPSETEIVLEILRGEESFFRGHTRLSAMKRSVGELVDHLFRDNSFPSGCFLLTGTGIVPPDDVALRVGDRVRITLEPIGALENPIVQATARSRPLPAGRENGSTRRGVGS